MDEMKLLVVLGMAATILIALFYIFRALLLWYWKIDEIVDLLHKIESHLRDSQGTIQLATQPQLGKASPHDSRKSEKKIFSTCPKCSAKQELDEDSIYCDQCGAPLEE